MSAEQAPASACTDAQRAEWADLHDRMQQLAEDAERAERMAASYLGDHLAAGAMTPGPYGVPTSEALDAYRRACEHAQEAMRLRAEREGLHKRAEEHPYTADVRARIAERRRAS